MIPDEPAPIDERLLAALLADEAALAEGRGLPDVDDADGARQGLRDCLSLLRQFGRREGADPGVGGPEPSEPLQFGRFTILGEVGCGGFGIVYRARDPLLGREVALKVPRPELIVSPDVRRRFLREARAAAGLDHPNIVPVHDAGPLGPLCFIASAYCPGPNLAQWLKARAEPVPPRLAARLVADLAGAAQHAHERGVLHRDLKPSNVLLVLPPEGDPVPRITDFGLAKLAEEGGDETRTQVLLGSPPYMAPEQAAGRPREVGPATDVHALGTILYEVLVGRQPYLGETRAETIRQVIESDPIAPRTLRPRLPRDLQTIVLTCLAKDPARRYRSAAALAEDLVRFLAGEPIRARPPSPARRAWSWGRRHPTVAASATLTALAVAGLIGVLAWSNARQQESIRQLRAAKAGAEQSAQEAGRQRGLARRHLDAANLRLARQALDAGEVERAQEILRDAETLRDGRDPRGFAWHYLWRNARREVIAFEIPAVLARAIAVAPDDRTVALADSEGTLVLWDLPSVRPRARLTSAGETTSFVAFSPDGHLVAAVGQDHPRSTTNRVRVWDAVRGRELARWEAAPGGTVLTFAFLGRGHAVGVVTMMPDRSNVVQILSLEDGPGRPRPIGAIGSLAGVASATGSRAFLVDNTQRLVLYGPDLTPPPERISGPHSLVGPWALSSDGRTLAGAVVGRGVLRWDVGSGAEIGAEAIGPEVASVAFGPGGSTLAIVDRTGLVHLRDPRPGRSHTLRPDGLERERNVRLAFSPDGARLATNPFGSPGGQQPVIVWDVATGGKLASLPVRIGQIRHLSFAADGRSLFLEVYGKIHQWLFDPGARAEPASPAGHADEAWCLAFAPDGRTLASGSDDTDEGRTIKLWDAASGGLLAGWKGHPATVGALAFHPAGRILASAGLASRDNLRLWEVPTGRLLATLPGHDEAVRALAFSPDGSVLGSAGSDHTVRLWDVATRRPPRILKGHTDMVRHIAFAPDGRTLASACNDGTVRLWEVATGRAGRVLSGAQKYSAVAFEPGGRALAAADESGGLTLWDPATGKVLGSIHGESDELRCLAYTPDGLGLAAAGLSGRIRIWDPVTGQEQLSLEGHKTQVNGLAFAPDGMTLASCSHDGAVRLWRGAPRTETDAIHAGADLHVLVVGGADHLPHAGDR